MRRSAPRLPRGQTGRHIGGHIPKRERPAPPIVPPVEHPDPRRPIFELFADLGRGADPGARTVAVGATLCDLRGLSPRGMSGTASAPIRRAVVIGRWRWSGGA